MIFVALVIGIFLYVTYTNQRQRQIKAQIEQKRIDDSIAAERYKEQAKMQAKAAKQRVKENKASERKKKAPTFAGNYWCARTHDMYHFGDDGRGYFKIQGGVSVSTFKWVRRGTNVTITYTGDDAVFGKQYLEYTEEYKLLTEESESFGTLSYFKMVD